MLADVEATRSARPFPPGDYPVVVVGSGPGGLQVSYSLRRLGIAHAVLSADASPGGMFRRWPFFQRLLSWTKPYAPAELGTPGYERYDWNSLLGEVPAHRSLMPGFMDGVSYFPSRAEMENNLVAFAERAGVPVRYGCEWTATRIEDGPGGDRVVVETTEGEYRCAAAVFAVGIAEPYLPATPGLEHAAHYAETRTADSYAGRRVFIAGKQNSGFELASGLLPWARQIVLASPSPSRLSVNTRSLVGVRARYLQPYEDHVLGGGVSVIDGSIRAIEVAPDGGLAVRLDRTDGGGSLAIEVDEAIAATGFVAPLRDLPALGVATFGSSQVPAQTPWWESATRPGVFFAGTLSQGAVGLKKHGLPANSGAVHGARYNARLLAGHLARSRFGVAVDQPLVAPDMLADRMVDELATSGALWHQKAYLAWVARADASGGFRIEGTMPLAHALDTDGFDALVLTLETDGSGAIYPVVYRRTSVGVSEHMLEPDPFVRFAGAGYRQALDDIVRQLRSPVTRSA
ncbi:MAG: NAD(P)-binding domain-containing protein [Chloroflexota bacterium]|nr:NAD(P)-binding domain-containing protein [Chloroflexota bacterium]MDQ3691987.1 NAD(P)-binding domain-containing protein [Chloroflexota bacterium]